MLESRPVGDELCSELLVDMMSSSVAPMSISKQGWPVSPALLMGSWNTPQPLSVKSLEELSD